MYALPDRLLPRLALIAALLHIAFRPATGKAECSLRPYGRPRPSDCVYILNHMMPNGTDSMGLVLWNSSEHPYMSLPLYWFYRRSQHQAL